MEGDNRSNYWPQILLILAAAANLLHFAPPLRSSRPAEPAAQARATISDPDIEARLWQDPFEALSLREARVAGSKPASTNGAVPEQRYSMDNLVGQMQWFAKNDAYEYEVTVLAVMVPGNTYSEGVEQRLRARYAVLAGLIERGVRPEQSELIGQVQVPWARSGSLRPEFSGARAPFLKARLDCESELLSIPYEWLTGRVPEPGQATNQLKLHAVLVLWLREEAFADYPKLRLAQLLGELRDDFYHKEYWKCRQPEDHPLRLRILGPYQSSTLIRMLETSVDKPERRFDCDRGEREFPEIGVAGHTVAEVLKSHGDENKDECNKKDDGKDTRFICANATAADEVLMIPPNWTNAVTPHQRFLTNNLAFERTCATDRELLKEILYELRRRGIHAGSANSPIAILTEYDTFYGRVMAETFTNLVGAGAMCAGTNQTPSPVVLHYLRGVDGRVAGEAELKKDKPEQTDKRETPEMKRALLEVPEGRSQLDYIPRLVKRLRAMEHGARFKAIGILGSDVYDKLLLLQSLRHEFPDVIFFTTELDARLFHPRELNWSRNLLVASSYGLQLENSLQGKIPPFRDSSQTALFVACLQAMNHPGFSAYAPEPRLFEIGRFGPVDLSTKPSKLHPSRPGLEGKPSAQEWKSLGWVLVLLPLLLAGLAPISPRLRQWLRILGILLGSFFSRCVRNHIHHPYTAEQGRLYSRWAWILLLLFVALLIVIHINHYSPEGEVFSLWDGVSIWPSALLRLVGFYLSLGGLAYGWFKLAASNRELAERYCLLPQSVGPWAVDDQVSRRDVFRAFLPWSRQRTSASISRWESDSDVRVNARQTWSDYLRLGSLQNRLNRFVPPSVVYFCFGTLLIVALGFPMVPYRGDWLTKWSDRLCLFLFIPAFILLMFAVLDDTRLCVKLIQLLAAKPTDWGEAQTKAAEARGMDREHLDDLLDVRFIAERTAAIGPLIYLPFGLLALMVISRNEVFDRWTWPLSLVALFGLNSLFTLYSAISLRRSANRARRAALRNLQEHRLRVLGSNKIEKDSKDSQIKQIDQIMEEIRSVKEGAFAPLPLNPALGAALLPFGSAGIIALLDYLATN